MVAKNKNNKKEQELKKVLNSFYKEVDKLEEEYNELVNELIKRISERRLREIKKEL